MNVLPFICCVQGREGVGRRHPGPVSQRSALRPHPPGGGSTAHEELEVGRVCTAPPVDIDKSETGIDTGTPSV